jgi:hypothetical protein
MRRNPRHCAVKNSDAQDLGIGSYPPPELPDSTHTGLESACMVIYRTPGLRTRKPTVRQHRDPRVGARRARYPRRVPRPTAHCPQRSRRSRRSGLAPPSFLTCATTKRRTPHRQAPDGRTDGVLWYHSPYRHIVAVRAPHARPAEHVCRCA